LSINKHTAPWPDHDVSRNSPKEFKDLLAVTIPEADKGKVHRRTLGLYLERMISINKTYSPACTFVAACEEMVDLMQTDTD